MKPPIFANFFGFSLKKKKNFAETPEGFKKTVKKIRGFQKNCLFRDLRKKIRFWNVKFYISKWDFLSQISKNTVFLKPPLKTKLHYNRTILMTKNCVFFVKKRVLFWKLMSCLHQFFWKTCIWIRFWSKMCRFGVFRQGFQAKKWPNVKKKHFTKTPLVESRSFITFSDFKTPI